LHPPLKSYLNSFIKYVYLQLILLLLLLLLKTIILYISIISLCICVYLYRYIFIFIYLYRKQIMLVDLVNGVYVLTVVNIQKIIPEIYTRLNYNKDYFMHVYDHIHFIFI